VRVRVPRVWMHVVVRMLRLWVLLYVMMLVCWCWCAGVGALVWVY